MSFRISVVIRTFNEGAHLEQVLLSLSRQTFTNFETIVVDSGSTDNTLAIAKKFHAKIVNIPKESFNYSFASNVGVQNSSGELVCFLSGHSVPKNNNYLEMVNRIFNDSKVGGCYGDVLALPDGSLTEKLFNFIGYLKNVLSGNKIVYEQQIHPGILSCNNACIRRDILMRHPFAEPLGDGGEDVEVAYRIIQDQYYVAKVPKLLVLHSHGSHFLKFLSEYRSWQQMYNRVEEYIGISKASNQ